MKSWIFGFCLAFCLQHIPAQLFANQHQDSFFTRSIAYESLNIQHASPGDCSALSDSYASRGEDYLILGNDQKALEDFALSYEYALNCRDEGNHLLFRPLFGAFLAYVRLENLEFAQEMYIHLDSMLRNACSGCRESSSHLSRHYSNEILSQRCKADYPILGPDEISIGECIERIETTVRAITLLISVVKKAEVKALAITLINQLANSAHNCCRAGGLWKGCLQKLVNKLHYWKVFGIPADPTWD